MYAIFRIKKLKSGGEIAASEFHTKRLRETPNADPTKYNERFIGDLSTLTIPTLEQEVFDRVGDNGGKKIRSDAVLCVEILMTASPEFFCPDNAGAAGQWDQQQLNEWKAANHEWLSNTFGDRLVQAELHLDEATPHIHAYLVPLDERGRLNCKSIFGDRKKLSQFQDSYAQAMQPLGLERGVKGSRATHTQVKEYYAAVTQPPDESITQTEIHHQLADRRRVLKENADLERTAKALAQENDRLQQQLRELELAGQRQHQETSVWAERYRAAVEQLREIPLTQIAVELGLDPDPKDQRKWRSDDHTLNITGSKFYDFHTSRGGGGAIDLVMHVEQCRFAEAMQWLKNRFGDGAALATATKQVQEIVAEKPCEPFVPPEAHAEHWQQVRAYLTQTRKLPAALVDQIHQQGLLYADEYQNAVFLRRSFQGEITGASLRGTIGSNNDFKGLAYGTRRSQGFFYVESEQPGEVQQVVVVESAIDALSYQTLHPPERKTRYLSTDGAGYVPVEQLRAVEVVIAFDNDAAGEAMAERLQLDLSQSDRHSPTEKDWNQELQRHLREMQWQFEQHQEARPLKSQPRKSLQPPDFQLD